MMKKHCEYCNRPALWKVKTPSGKAYYICDKKMEEFEERFESANDIEVDVITA